MKRTQAIKCMVDLNEITTNCERQDKGSIGKRTGDIEERRKTPDLESHPSCPCKSFCGTKAPLSCMVQRKRKSVQHGAPMGENETAETDNERAGVCLGPTLLMTF